MFTRDCPVCQTSSSEANLFLKRNIDPSRLSGYSFASRKSPEFMSYELVQCLSCDLVYASDAPDHTTLAEAYHLSEFDSAEEADDAAIAYEAALVPMLEKLRGRQSALEIGTGTGIFLETLKARGFEVAVGVEPSAAAIAAAPPHRRAWIREATFIESDFQPASFDFICCFMTLEHVRNPGEVVSAAGRLLRPGGALALVTHDYRSPINRMLGKRSPIIDIEHMQLFSRKSIREILTINSFELIEIQSFKNSYSLSYWIRLLPIPLSIKNPFIKLFNVFGLGKIKVGLNVGNILTVAYRSLK